MSTEEREGQLAVYGRERELLFVNQGALFAQDFDPDTLALSGDPQRIALPLLEEQ